MKIVNLTPHPLNLRMSDGSDVVIATSGIVARVASKPGVLTDIGIGIPVATPTTFGEIEGLPAPEEGVVYVASMLVADRARRPDVLSPGTGPSDEAIRDESGRIKAVTRLIAWV